MEVIRNINQMIGAITGDLRNTLLLGGGLALLCCGIWYQFGENSQQKAKKVAIGICIGVGMGVLATTIINSVVDVAGGF